MRNIILGFILVLSFSLNAQEKGYSVTESDSKKEIGSAVLDKVNESGSDDKIYVTNLDSAAGPKGSEGMLGFYKQFAHSFRAPSVGNGVNQIRVMLSFVIEKDGSFTDVKVLRDPGYGVANEAIRVLKSMPYWTPAILDGKPVRSQFTLPITIQIR